MRNRWVYIEWLDATDLSGEAWLSLEDIKKENGKCNSICQQVGLIVMDDEKNYILASGVIRDEEDDQFTNVCRIPKAMIIRKKIIDVDAIRDIYNQ